MAAGPPCPHNYEGAVAALHEDDLPVFAMLVGRETIDPLPGGHLRDGEVVRLIANRLEQVAARTRERIAGVASLDPVSEDLLISVAATLEKELWMLRAQRADG